MIPVHSITLRPRSWIVLLALIPLVIFIVVANNLNDDTTLKVVSGVALLVPVAFYIYHVNSCIEISNDGIMYKNPFITKWVKWDDIKRSYLRMNFGGNASKSVWFFENSSGRKSFAINMYSRRSLHAIAEALITKCPDAYLDRTIRNMAEGKFPWYIF